MEKGIEKFKAEEEKSPIENLKERQEKDNLIKKEDPLHPAPLHAINLDKLHPALLELYKLYEGGEIDAAKADIQVAGEKIREMQDKKTKENNEKFLNWIDDKIVSEFSKKQLSGDQSLIE